MLERLLPAHYPWNLLLLADPSRQVVERYLKDAVVLGCKEDREIVGVVVLIKLTTTSWEIKNIAVSPVHQGRGLGKTLLRNALEVCREQGAREIWIGTGNSSINQLALYQKVGFRMMAVERDYFVRNYDEEILENGITCRDMVRLVFTI